MTVQTLTRVAFQGVPGAYSEIAALSQGTHAQGYASFQEILDAVQHGECDLAALPIENSLAGTVHQAIDLLFHSDLYSVSEVMVRVRHQLLGLPNSRLEDIRKVYSHPQALAQCDGFLRKHGISPIPAYDTAGSAHDLSVSQEVGAACIASKRAAELYGLDILAPDIEDEDFNTTRFLVLSRERRPLVPNLSYKTTVVFAVRHQAGSLVEALMSFRDQGVNLCKLESRPRRDRPWSYLFYIDIEGHTSDPPIQAALTQLMASASMVKVLGSYPTAQVTV